VLFADRTSTALLRSNQIRWYFSSVAYLLVEALRRQGWRERSGPARNVTRCDASC
jgi:hypothetical protein